MIRSRGISRTFPCNTQAQIVEESRLSLFTGDPDKNKEKPFHMVTLLESLYDLGAKLVLRNASGELQMYKPGDYYLGRPDLGALGSAH